VFSAKKGYFPPSTTTIPNDRLIKNGEFAQR
jgi:hypothetical protein